MVDIGYRLKAIRKKLRVQQKEMATALQIEPAYFSDIENGKVNPGADFFLKLVDKYNVNPNYLFLGTGEIVLSSEREITDEEIDLNMKIDSIPNLVWLMERSPYFKVSILSIATRILFEDGEIIRQTIKINRLKKETKNE